MPLDGWIKIRKNTEYRRPEKKIDGRWKTVALGRGTMDDGGRLHRWKMEDRCDRKTDERSDVGDQRSVAL